MDKRPSLIALPITGTTELIANLIERRPMASALEATAVFIDKTDTKNAAAIEMAVVIYFFKKARRELRLSSLLSPEQIPIARKQFVNGTKMFLEI